MLLRQLLASRRLGRHQNLHVGQGEGEETEILQEATAARQGLGGRVGNALVMHLAPIRVAQKEDRERRIDQEDIFHRVVFFLAAITVFLLSRPKTSEAVIWGNS